MPKPTSARPWIWAPWAVVAVSAYALLGLALHQRAYDRQWDTWQTTLAASGRTRLRLLENWLDELEHSARSVARYPTAIYLLQPDPVTPDGRLPFPLEEGAEGHLRGLLREFLDEHHYDAAWLIDTDGRVRGSSNPGAALPEGALELARAAGAADSMRADVLGGGEQSRLIAAVPVFVDGAGPASGALVLQVTPARFLFEPLQTETTPTDTGEGMLVRFEEAGFVLLSPLRKPFGGAVELSDTSLASFRAMRAPHMVEAPDYAGTLVWANAHPVKGTPWHLVNKIDRQEALADGYNRLLLQLLALAGVYAAILGVAYGVWRHMHSRHAAESASQRQRFATYLDRAQDPILFLDEDGVIVDVNERAVEFYGRPRAQLLGRPASDLRTEKEKTRFREHISTVQVAGMSVIETCHVRADGAEIPVEISARLVESGGEAVIVTIIRDLTERRRAEDRIAFLNRGLRTLSEIDSAITRETEPPQLFDRACTIAVDHARFVAAAVILIEPDGTARVAASRNIDAALADDLLARHGHALPFVRTLEAGNSIVARDCFLEPGRATNNGVVLGTVRSCAAAPLVVDGGLTGCFALYAAEADFFTEEVLRLVEQISADLGFALHVMRERDEAERGREQARRMQQENDERFRWIADHAPDLIYQVRLLPSPAVEYVSPAATMLTGYTPEEFVADPGLAERLVHPADLERVRAAMSSDVTEPFTVRIMRRDGSVAWLEQHVSRVRAADGRLATMLGVVRDVTSAHIAERELRDAKERLELAMAVARQGSYEVDVPRRVVLLPPSTMQLLGAGDRAAEVGLDDWLTWIHPDDRAALTARWEAVLMADAPEPSMNVFRLRDREAWIRLHGRVVERSAEGHPLRLVGMMTEVSDVQRAENALKRSQERYRAIVENSPDIVARIDRQLRFLYVSPAAQRYQALPPEQYLGKTLREAGVPERLCTILNAAMRGVLEDGRPRELEYASPDEDGPYFFDHRVFPELDERGNTVAVVSVSRDISAKRRLEAEFHHAQKLEAVGRLAGGVAHDFNNILTAITGHATLAGGRTTDPEVQSDLDEIVAAADRASSLTRQLLAFSRKQIVQPRRIDLGDTVRTLERMVRRLIGEDIELQLALPSIVLPVLCDPGQVEQVLMNLCVNARDAMPHGGTLGITVARERIGAGHAAAVPPGEYAVLGVTDSGMGIPADVLPHIFEPFFTTKDAGRGTGLGLSTVYGIVQQNGGQLRVESEPGQGSTFALYLPIARGDLAAPTELREEVDAAPSRPLTILVAEDEERVRSLLATVLRKRGHTLLVAANGESALALAARHPGEIDVLLSDVVMPGMGGRELSRQLTGLRPGLVTVFITGYTADEGLRQDFADASVHVIPKPFTPSQLFRRIEAAAAGVEAGVS